MWLNCSLQLSAERHDLRVVLGEWLEHRQDLDEELAELVTLGLVIANALVKDSFVLAQHGHELLVLGL